MEYVNEGPQDPNIFKAIFMAGGPGSGKSYFGKKLAKGVGLLYINVDDFVEMMSAKHKLDVSAAGRDPKFKEKSRYLKSQRLALGLQGRLGLLIDGTSRNYIKTEEAKNELEDIGYDTMMLYVDTDMATAQERNSRRERVVGQKFLIKAHRKVKANVLKYQSLFNNFVIIDNSEPQSEEHKQYLENEFNQSWKQIRHFLTMSNQTAQNFKQQHKG